MSRKLVHPNVLRLFDLGLHQGFFYILMEYVDGRTLAHHLAEIGHLSLGEFFPIFDDFCNALAWVHSHNVIHRDIKPSNVMFTRDGTLKLMDFGIAKELTGSQLRSTIIGTPGYVAPEQLCGLPLGPTADIYSAGAMFFELLTGKRPLARKALADQFKGPPPSLLTELPDAPVELAQIIAKCLEPVPSKRFQSVEELRAAAANIQPRHAPAVPGRLRLLENMTDEPPDVEQTIPLLLKVVNRVREIHAAGRYHPELSPRNIWITPTGGVEIEARDAPPAQGTLTITDPKYVSPESLPSGRRMLRKPGFSRTRTSSDSCSTRCWPDAGNFNANLPMHRYRATSSGWPGTEIQRSG